MSKNDASSATERGEWECDACGYIIMTDRDSPPRGKCPDCGESAAESFVFYEYGDHYIDSMNDDDEDNDKDDAEDDDGDDPFSVD